MNLSGLDPTEGSRPLEAVRFAVLDVETTGLDHEDRVIEVACVVTRGRDVQNSLDTFVNPERDIPPEVIAIHGIRAEDVRGAPKFAEVMPKVADLLAGSVIVAHNASYDVSFLRREFGRAGDVFPRLHVCDTLLLARNLILTEHYSLEALSEHYALRNRPAHRAMADVRTTHELLWKLIDSAESRPATLRDLLSLLIPPRVSWEDAESEGLVAPPLVDLRKGLEDEASIQLTYVGRSGEETTHTIAAKYLERSGGHLYLRAQVVGESDVKVFRLDRITSAEVVK